MRTGITPNEFAPAIFMQEGSSKQNNDISETPPDTEAKKAELENELKKKKALAEKAAKLMQEIWGDKFQSDSLY